MNPRDCGGRGVQAAPVGRRQALWSLLFLVIVAASVWAVTSQVRGFSFEGFMECVREASVLWLALAVACMLLHVFSEGAAILQICKSFGYPRRASDGFAYASADIYFSAITPSATGGQPASAFFMMRDGIPGPVSTVALLVNLIMYTLSIVVIGAFCFAVRPGVYAMFSPLARGMILAGCAVQLGLATLFLLLLREHRLLHRICDGALGLLAFAGPGTAVHGARFSGAAFARTPGHQGRPAGSDRTGRYRQYLCGRVPVPGRYRSPPACRGAFGGRSGTSPLRFAGGLAGIHRPVRQLHP